jgi:hypothetical protein
LPIIATGKVNAAQEWLVGVRLDCTVGQINDFDAVLNYDLIVIPRRQYASTNDTRHLSLALQGDQAMAAARRDWPRAMAHEGFSVQNLSALRRTRVSHTAASDRPRNLRGASSAALSLRRAAMSVDRQSPALAATAGRQAKVLTTRVLCPAREPKYAAFDV